jgi:hypothetical protein
MGKKMNQEEISRLIFVWLDGKKELTSAEQKLAYHGFQESIKTAAKRTLYRYNEEMVSDLTEDILKSLLITIRRNGIPDKPKAYLDTTIRNGLKKLFGSKSDAYKVIQKKTYAEMLESLENSGKIYSNNIRVSINSGLEGDSIDEYSIYGYIYDLAPNYEKLNEDFVLDLLKEIDGPVEISLLLNQIVNYLYGEKDITLSLDGGDGEDVEGEYPSTPIPIPDEQLMQDELVDISLFTERIMKRIEDFSKNEKLGEELFIKLLYLTMTTKTSKEIAEITGMASKNVEYYTSARAGKSTRSVIKQWIDELAALLINRSRDQVISIFQNEIMGKMEVEYESYLKGIK